jgi:hypothetical protein
MRYLLLFAGDQEAFNAMGPEDAHAMFGQIGLAGRRQRRDTADCGARLAGSPSAFQEMCSRPVVDHVAGVRC